MPRARANKGARESVASRATSRESAEKREWDWVEHVTDVHKDVGERHIQLAYKLHYPTHVDSQCKKNCKANPKCYSALGRAKWLAETARESSQKDKACGQKTTDEEEFEDSDDEDESCFERRKRGLPIGLKNLGNTCYVNSFLQIWFHNTQFRNALYSWDPEHDDEERNNKTLRLADEEYRPEGIIANLQALFAVMEFSNRKAVDPNDFITKLGLDPSVQQDAQEFSKLFQGVLESKLINQRIQVVKSMIQTQFCGGYDYVTTCLTCKRESKRPSSFYELDLTLQGNKTLYDCMDGFLKEERLEGDNQYFCEGCFSKQDARRCVRLSSLPTVLNLQLNRFIFDMSTGRKKKLNSYVQFPEELDMSPYVGSSGNHIYSLKGVLMHVGAEANHGHYIAHIQEANSQRWFKFSDAQVEPLDKNSSIQLGSEKDPMTAAVNGKASSKKYGKSSAGGSGVNGTSAAGAKQTSSKWVRSNSAYMLVYSLNQSSIAASPESKKSSNLTNIVQKLAEKKKIVDSPGRSKQPQQQQTRTQTRVANADPLKGDHCVEGTNGTLTFPVSFPMRLKAYVERDRTMFEEQISENKIEKRENLNKKENLHARMRNFSLKLVLEESGGGGATPGTPGGRTARSRTTMAASPTGEILSDEDELDEDFEFVPKALLQKFLEDPSSTSALSDTARLEFKCCHGKLNLDKLGELKVVSSASADEMYSYLNIEPTGDSIGLKNGTSLRDSGVVSPSRAAAGKRDKWDRGVLCHTCVRNRCREMILENKLKMNYKEVTDLSKAARGDASGGSQYWLGRSSWRKWRTIAKDNFRRTIEAETRVFVKNEAANSPGRSPPLSPFLPTLNGDESGGRSSPVQPVVVKPDPEEDANHAFNEDIACVHGKLCPKSDKKRMSVSNLVWDILKPHFPGCLEFPVSGSQPCGDCLDTVKSEYEIHESKRVMATQHKNTLSDILNERNRPSWSKASLNRVYLVPRDFVISLRAFCKNPLSQQEVITIGNEMLLCEHGDLMYPPRLDTESDYESIVFMVYEEEWRELSRVFKIDREIEVRRHFEGPDVLTSDPKVCDNCVRDRIRKEEEERLTYSNEPVYVRRLMGSERDVQMALAAALTDDPDFDQAGKSGDNAVDGGGSEPACKRPKTTKPCIPSELKRRSNRRQKVRGEKEFFVSSDMLLRDFKVKIMQVYKIPPFDQNLSVDGRYLTDTKQTLGQLRVLPKSLIYLRADEPAPGSAAAAAHVSETEECWTSQNPEEGFKGTGLLSGF